MKKLVVLTFVLLFVCTFANAAEDFNNNGWSEHLEGEVTFSPTGTTLGITASDSGQYSWGEYSIPYSDALGELATFNITSASGNSTLIGLRKYVARNSSGNRIMAEIKIQNWEGNHSIQYRIKERLGDTTTDVQVLARGYFGDFDGTWSPGEDIQMGIWYNDSVVYFYCSKFPEQVSQVHLPQITSDLERIVDVVAYTENGSNIAATVSDLNVSTSLEQMSSATGVSLAAPVVAIQPDLSFSVPSMSYGALDIWVDFKFVGTVDGKMTWEFEGGGVNE